MLICACNPPDPRLQAGGTNTWGDTDDLDELEAQRTSKSKLKKMLVGAMARLKKSRKGERERGGTG